MTTPTTVVSATVVTTNRNEVADVMRAFAEAAADLAADGIDVSVSATVAPDDVAPPGFSSGGAIPPLPERVDLGDDPDGDNS